MSQGQALAEAHHTKPDVVVAVVRIVVVAIRAPEVVLVGIVPRPATDHLTAAHPLLRRYG